MLVRLCIAIVLAAMPVFVSPVAQAADGLNVSDSDWAWWRGPNRNGVANTEQPPPTQWDDESNVLWKSPVPGRGHGSPTVVGDRIFLATADEEREVQSVLCYDRATGEQLWKTDVHEGGFESAGRQGHARSTRASSTVASDGERAFINFINSNAVFTTALDFAGNQLWQQKVTDYIIHQGYGSSPTVYEELVIVSADNKAGGAITAFDRTSGDVVWTHKRPELPNYASPVVLKIEGRDQLILTGVDVISSFDPLTGDLNWEVPGATTECVTSAVTDGKLVVTSGGYPDKHISVLRGDGTGEVLWRNEREVYVPSMLVKGGHLYGVADSGHAFCYELETGELQWEERLRGKFSASPILVGDLIYSTGYRGTTYIFKADPNAFELVAENTIAGDAVEATPAICAGRIYMRIPKKEDDGRQEMLYCIGTAP